MSQPRRSSQPPPPPPPPLHLHHQPRRLGHLQSFYELSL